jgi:hypothetical protein
MDDGILGYVAFDEIEDVLHRAEVDALHRFDAIVADVRREEDVFVREELAVKHDALQFPQALRPPLLVAAGGRHGVDFLDDLRADDAQAKISDGVSTLDYVLNWDFVFDCLCIKKEN